MLDTQDRKEIKKTQDILNNGVHPVPYDQHLLRFVWDFFENHYVINSLE